MVSVLARVQHATVIVLADDHSAMAIAHASSVTAQAAPAKAVMASRVLSGKLA
jgi:hypothetical protein